MKKKAKRIAKIMRNNTSGVVAQMIDDEAKGVRYEVYTDGSCKNNKCGCGWLVLHKGAIVNTGKKLLSSIYNDSVRAEVRAIVYALDDCPSSCAVDVYVDCQAAIRKIQTGKLGDLSLLYNKVANGKIVRFHWIKAHGDNIYNEMVDSLAFSTVEC